MKTPHKWAKEIKAWAEGATIQWRHIEGTGLIWQDCQGDLNWDDPWYAYRIKPEEPKPVTQYTLVLRGTNPKLKNIVHYGHALFPTLEDLRAYRTDPRVLGVLETTLKDGQIVGIKYWTKDQVKEMLK